MLVDIAGEEVRIFVRCAGDGFGVPMWSLIRMAADLKCIVRYVRAVDLHLKVQCVCLLCSNSSLVRCRRR